MRKALSVLFMLALVFSFPALAFASHGKDLDCKDFASQAEAQKHWDEHGYSADNDPERLDADGDGVPCEDGEGSGGGSDNSGSDKSDSSDNSGSDKSGSESNNQQGGKMPKTATPYPTYSLLGSVILAAGVGLLLYRRRTA